jgi:tetratricopeptide (TPR) repeat protein
MSKKRKQHRSQFKAVVALNPYSTHQAVQTTPSTDMPAKVPDRAGRSVHPHSVNLVEENRRPYDSAHFWHERGIELYKFEDQTSAEEAFKKGLALYRSIIGMEHLQFDCAMKLGNICLKTNRYSDANNYFQEAFTICNDIPDMQQEQVICKVKLGDIHRMSGKNNAAEQSYKEALSIYKNITGTDLFQARCTMHLGNICRDIGRYKEAERFLKEALKIYQIAASSELDLKKNQMDDEKHKPKYVVEKQKPNSSLPIFYCIELDKASCIHDMGIIYMETGRYGKAENTLKEALLIYREIILTQREQADCIMNLSKIYRSTGRYIKSGRSYSEALKLYQSITDSEREQATCLAQLAMLFSHEVGYQNKACRYAEQALKLCIHLPVEKTIEIRDICENILYKSKAENIDY